MEAQNINMELSDDEGVTSQLQYITCKYTGDYSYIKLDGCRNKHTPVRTGDKKHNQQGFNVTTKIVAAE